MSIDSKTLNQRGGTPAGETRALPRAKRHPGLSLDTEPHKPGNAQRSPDPYNTSGSFDRTKNWARIGKR